MSINSKTAMMNFEEKEMMRKLVDSLFLRVQDLEQRPMADSTSMEIALREMENRLNNNIEQYTS